MSVIQSPARLAEPTKNTAAGSWQEGAFRMTIETSGDGMKKARTPIATIFTLALFKQPAEHVDPCHSNS
ncbi:MAG TPA: hypothetical protein VFC46_14675 [Humisphaera sp.]|nr:hypothetical protein [Humisphaera sp.]